MKINSDPLKENRFTTSLLEWCTNCLRNFPWRRDRTLYNVFISEFFLQRTKADQVKPVYLSFIQKFPSFLDLFSATEAELNMFFNQLGLMKRAHYMQKIIEILKFDNRSFENYTIDEIKQLPGIGNYTGNAIACFGLDLRVPLVDSNIVRIFKRFFEIESEKKTPRNDTEIWDFAFRIMPDENYVIYNYALIDFGALICTPKNPKCQECPFISECSFYKKVQIL
jgi:A/G-specific adenine glycosylase